MATQAPLVPTALDGIKKDFANAESRGSALDAARSWIVRDLGNSEMRAEVVKKLIKWDWIKTEPDHCARLCALVTWLCSVIGAFENFGSIYAFLESLTAHIAPDSLLSDLPVELAERCLSRYPVKTNYFVLGLLERGFIDVDFIFTFLRDSMSPRLELVGIFLYFGPELIAFRPAWYRDVWKFFHTPQATAYFEWNPTVIESTYPEFPMVLAEVDWAEQEHNRWTWGDPSRFESIITVRTVGLTALCVHPPVPEGRFTGDQQDISKFGFSQVLRSTDSFLGSRMAALSIGEV
jgi:hypothetical protein